jgi:hypothetical protein
MELVGCTVGGIDLGAAVRDASMAVAVAVAAAGRDGNGAVAAGNEGPIEGHFTNVRNGVAKPRHSLAR